MTKLYKLINKELHYWETWDNKAIVHWGKVGERGEDKGIISNTNKNYKITVEEEIVNKKNDGYVEIEEFKILLIEYEIEGMGNVKDIDKRYDLEDRMNETLGWAGLGHCDGGSIGSGTMEVCCFVVDFEIAKDVIVKDLKGTGFGNYTRIYTRMLRQ